MDNADRDHSYSDNSNTAHAGQDKENPPSACLVIMNGLPAVGKYLILGQVQKGLKDKNIILRSGLLRDIATGVCPDTEGRQHKAICKRLRYTVFPDIAGLCHAGTFVLMTATFSDSLEDLHVFVEYVVLSRSAGVRIIWINAHCHPRILKARAHYFARVRGEKSKLTDWEFVAGFVDSKRLLCPPNYSILLTDIDFKFVSLDVSGSIEVTVEKIIMLIRSSNLREERTVVPEGS